ncbi:unnamed protein product [Ascophyllum nodosum]
MLCLRPHREKRGKIGPMRPLQRVEADSKTGPDPGVDLSSDMKALNMQEVSAKNQPAGGAGEESAVEKRGPLVPEERRRLMVASMCPEDIVLCVDIGPEMGSKWCGAGPGGVATTRMRVVQAALVGFVRRKSSFNHRHRFALCIMGKGVQVVRPLTSDVRSVQDAIERLQHAPWPETPIRDELPFDFSALLACIAERFPPLNPPASTMGAAVSQIRPVVRAVVVYGRSYTCPLVPVSGETQMPLLSHGRFFFDCLYIHRKPSEDDVVCQEVFDLIAAMETHGDGSHSYLLECGHNLQRFNANMASLLAHPVQRDLQEAFFNKLNSGGGTASGEPGTAAPVGYRESPSRVVKASGIASNSLAMGGSATP